MSRTRSAHALSRPAVPRHARRVSGPVARPRPVPVPGQPRARGGRDPIPQPHSSFGAAVRALPDHRLLDTLLRSRAWIWLLGIALGGIVFMQVSLLGMNAGIGRAVAESTALEQRNAQLRETIAERSSGELIRATAARSGLITPQATDVEFLRARRGGDGRRAADQMRPPTDEARQALATGGRPATTTAPTTTTTTTTAVAPTATVAPVATAAPATTIATPAPTAAAPADPVTHTTTTSTGGGVTAAP